jgi:hypothetical protein
MLALTGVFYKRAGLIAETATGHAAKGDQA